MAPTVKHAKTSSIPDSGDASLIEPSDWNANHVLTGVQGTIALTTTGTSGAATFDGTTLNVPVYTESTGTVTGVSVATANGLAGTSNADPATPILTLSTTVTGVLKGNGTAISAAIANTDYQSPITLTTTGSSGAATFSANTLNIPQYASASTAVTAVSVASANGFAGSSSGGTTPALTLSTSITGVLKGNGTALSAATAGTDYSAGTSALSTGILKSTTSTGALSIAAAGTDYEVPLTFSTGLTRSTNTITVNTSQNIATLSNLTSNGLVTTSGAVGTLGITVPGTGILTALGVNVGSAGAPVLFNGAGGTPSSLTGTNISGTAASLTSGITNALKSATTTVDVSAATAPSANQVLTATDSTHATWVTPSSGGLTIGTDSATTSGSAVSFTSLPSTIKQLTMSWRDGSTNNASATVGARLGDATTGGFVTTGYVGFVSRVASTTVGGTATETITVLSDRVLWTDTVGTAAGLAYATMTVTLVNSSSHIYQFAVTWTESLATPGTILQTNTTTGYVTLAGALDRVEILTGNSFDGGSVNIAYQ